MTLQFPYLLPPACFHNVM